MKPSTMGPSTGPRKTLAVNKLVAGPRPTGGQISVRKPTIYESGEDNSKKNRLTSDARERCGGEECRQEANDK